VSSTSSVTSFGVRSVESCGAITIRDGTTPIGRATTRSNVPIRVAEVEVPAILVRFCLGIPVMSSRVAWLCPEEAADSG
jgi:hypothetical protein